MEIISTLYIHIQQQIEIPNECTVQAFQIKLNFEMNVDSAFIYSVTFLLEVSYILYSMFLSSFRNENIESYRNYKG